MRSLVGKAFYDHSVFFELPLEAVLEGSICSSGCDVPVDGFPDSLRHRHLVSSGNRAERSCHFA